MLCQVIHYDTHDVMGRKIQMCVLTHQFPNTNMTITFHWTAGEISGEISVRIYPPHLTYRPLFQISNAISPWRGRQVRRISGRWMIQWKETISTNWNDEASNRTQRVLVKDIQYTKGQHNWKWTILWSHTIECQVLNIQNYIVTLSTFTVIINMNFFSLERKKGIGLGGGIKIY